jgi:hypothetical protein
MSITEAALYGQLIKYLRDVWAEEAARSRSSSIVYETARIDGHIRAWLFTPKRELCRMTPRDVIRNEQRGAPNVVPHDLLDEELDDRGDDCALCEMVRADVIAGDAEMSFVYAPDATLLDEYDPDGADDDDEVWLDDGADHDA